MEKSYFIKLTVVLYRVTELFPKKEPLKFSLRKKAGDILAETVLVFGDNPLASARAERKELLERILKNIKIIHTLFELAESQDWVKRENFLVLRREYDKIAQQAQQARQAMSAERETPAQEPSQLVASQAVGVAAKEQRSPAASVSFAGLKDRQKKILRFLQGRGKAQVKDIKEILPEVTKRTLRRDFDLLLKRGLVERRGDRNKTEYKVR